MAGKGQASMRDQAAALYPDVGLLEASARSCAWPSVLLELPGWGRPVRVPANRLAWQAFIAWAEGPARLAAWEALEEWEREMRRELEEVRP